MMTANAYSHVDGTHFLQVRKNGKLVEQADTKDKAKMIMLIGQTKSHYDNGIVIDTSGLSFVI